MQGHGLGCQGESANRTVRPDSCGRVGHYVCRAERGYQSEGLAHERKCHGDKGSLVVSSSATRPLPLLTDIQRIKADPTGEGRKTALAIVITRLGTRGVQRINFGLTVQAFRALKNLSLV